MQLLVTLSGYDGGTLVIDVPAGSSAADCGRAIVARASRSKCSGDAAIAPSPSIALLLTRNGRPYLPDEPVWPSSKDILDNSPVIILARPRGAVLGGKGGFGANLRAQGRASGVKGSTNFGACRDLSGRRLSSVNNEARLRSWLSAEETAKRAEAVRAGAEPTEAAGPTGAAGWLLAAPSWAEGTTEKGDKWSRPRKTVVCRDWTRAREEKAPPFNAPRSWGCPRGNRCEYAHGEEELRAEGRVAAAAAAKERAAAAATAALEAATKGLYVYGGGAGGAGGGTAPSMLDAMRAGLSAKSAVVAPAPTAARKRTRNEDEDGGVAWGDSAQESFLSFSRGRQGPSAAPAASSADISPQLQSEHSWVSSAYGQASDVATFDYRHTPTTRVAGSSSLAPFKGDEALPSPRFSRVDITAMADFVTCTTTSRGVARGEGHWHFEIEVVTAGGVVQVGWATAGVSWAPKFEQGEGVGDDDASWAFDASRALKWNSSASVVAQDAEAVHLESSGSSPYGVIAVAGDIIGASARFNAAGDATLSFFVNGMSLGDAFFIPNGLIPNGLLPAISLDAGEIVTMNMGSAGFAYAPDDSRGVFSSTGIGAASGVKVEASATNHPASSMAASCAAAIVEPVAAQSGPLVQPPIDLFPLLAAADERFHASCGSKTLNVSELASAGASINDLANALTARGAKSGGTWHERAARLASTVGFTRETLPKKIRAAK
jgi:hypothetical protein